MSFRAYRDKWSLNHKGQAPIKENLALWVSQCLRRALFPENIRKVFSYTSIFPLNPKAMDCKIGPSRAYQTIGEGRNNENNAAKGEEEYQLPQWELEKILNEVPTNFPNYSQYYVNIDGEEDETMLGEGKAFKATNNGTKAMDEGFNDLLRLSRISLPVTPKARTQVKIDYHKSVVLTQEDHVEHLEVLATIKDEVAHDKQMRQLEKAVAKEKRVQLKTQKLHEKQARQELVAAKKKEKEKCRLQRTKAPTVTYTTSSQELRLVWPTTIGMPVFYDRPSFPMPQFGVGPSNV